MKTPHKTILLSSGIALGVIAVVFGATAGIADKHKNFEATSASQYSLLLNSSNAPSGLSTSSFTETIQTTIATDSGNSLTFNIAMAKASNNNYVEIGYNGYMYNFGAETGRIKGITAITPVLASGSLKLSTSNVEFASGAYLGSAIDLASGSRKVLDSPARFFQLKAGDSGAVITSLLIEYSCTGDADAYPTQKDFLEDFSGFSTTGIGYDGSHGYGITTGLRAEYYSTYRGVSSPDPADGTSWQIMGSDDYITYLSNKGRSSSKCGLFKVNSNNSFKYFQTKAFFGVNSIIGKGNRLSFWARGAYTGTNASTNSSYNIELIAMAFYSGAKWNKSGSNSNIVTKTFTITAGSDWTEYTLDLEKTKNVYAYGFCLKKADGTAYVPIDDISITTVADVNVTGVSLNKNNAEIEIGGTTTLTATVTPNNATNKAVTWTSSNTSVATVSNGTVSGVAAGNATITVTTVDGGYTATCAVTVSAPVPYPTGTYKSTVSVLGKSVDLVISIGTRSNGMVAVCLANTDAEATSISYNNSTKQITIQTTGSYSSATFGTITATYDDTNDKLTKVKCDGGVSSYVSNNGKLTATRPTVYEDCDGTTSELQSKFKRRYDSGGGWQVDNSNADRVASNTTHFVSGIGSVSLRGFLSGGSGRVALNFNSDFASAKSVTNVQFWVYNPTNSDITLRMWYYKAKNFGSNAETGSVIAKANGWTYLAMGFGTQSIYNFQIADFDNSGAYLTFDSLSLF